MALIYDGAIQDVIDSFAHLPGIGPKGAQRIAFHLLSTSENDVKHLAQAITTLREKVRFCEICGNVTEISPCAICQDPRRDHSVICVVEHASDIMAIENTAEYHGLYHVLGGAINPMGGIGPADLRIQSGTDFQSSRRLYPCSGAGKISGGQPEDGRNFPDV